MKRFASLDFLRGLAILIMIILHIITRILDLDTLFDNINNEPFINIIALIVLPFLGGLAGFFLLTSAISNMVSMYKTIEKGLNPNQLIKRQVIGGFLILLFAMLAEGTTGYLGAFGLIVRDIGSVWRPELYITTALSRWNHFEAIHTIAWCVIINGIIQGLLSRNGGYKDVPKLIKKYILIAICVVALTVPVWVGINYLFPGYPFAIDPQTGLQMYTPLIGTSPAWYIIISPFLAMLAAQMEPLFPYLAVSCVGSIIGIIISQAPEQIPKNFVKKTLLLALLAFIIGAVGLVITIIGIMDSSGFNAAVDLYKNIPFHRHWFPDQPKFGPYVNYFSWLWQFLVLNGFGTMFTMMVIYLVEFRGVGPQFGNFKSVIFVRRFGFTAFTNYNNQWYYYIVWLLVSLAFTGQAGQHFLWGEVLLIVVLTLLLYHIIMKLWEKVGYVGSIEWMIGTIAGALLPMKRKEGAENKKWWEKGKLDVAGAFYNVEWQSVITPDEEYHKSYRDSKSIEKISKIALISVLFFGFNVFTLLIALDAKKTEGNNPHVKKAILFSTIGTIITVIFLIVCFAATPNMLGIPL